MEKQHCELQKYHYEAVQNSLEYRIAGQMEIMREELLMNIPPAEDVPQKGTDVPKMSTPEPTDQIDANTRLNREQRGMLQQLHGEVFYLRNKLTEHLDRSKKKNKYI